MLKPVAVYPDGAHQRRAVMCEVMMPDGVTRATNKRATVLDDAGAWFGFEQEYFFYKDGRPLGFPAAGYPGPQGPTPASATRTSARLRARSSKHLDLCLAAGINHEGINAEVAKTSGNSRSSARAPRPPPTRWMARYLMMRLCETYEVDIEWHCKPLGDTDWNGSGMHCNFSTEYMRTVGGKDYFEALMKQFDKNLMDHIAVYGGQRQAPDRQARDRAVEQVQLRHCRPRRLDPRAALVHQE